jgi:hypothetical protein
MGAFFLFNQFRYFFLSPLIPLIVQTDLELISHDSNLDVNNNNTALVFVELDEISTPKARRKCST